MKRILLVSGSLRQASTNTAVLRTLAHVAGDMFDFRLYDGLDRLPAFNPDLEVEPLPAGAGRLRAEVHSADAMIFSVPEYAGALPGSLKNLLDWLIGDESDRSIHQKPVGWINVSPRGAAGAHTELATVLAYAHARLLDKACIRLPISTGMVGSDGLITDAEARAELRAAAAHFF